MSDSSVMLLDAQNLTFCDVVQGLVESATADMQAVLDRDPACYGFLQIMLFFKGFQAIQAYRISHYLWSHGRVSLAHAVQSRISQQFDVDIHPAAHLGRGIMLDHATGIVIGETAVIGDNVSMLHGVTIGGSGAKTGIRHPTIGHGVLIGAGVSVLGPISVGHSSKIGACSVVVQDVPEKSVAVGVPARVVKQDKSLEPCKDMDSAGDFVLDFVI
jgi:serine O-acetyltransferase